MSTFLDDMIARAKADKQTIVLPEGNDIRTLVAAREVVDRDIANVIVLGTPEDILAGATAYARASFLAMPLLFPFIAVAALMRGIGDSIRPLLVQIVVTVVSAALTVLMVRRLDMGVAAAAISTGTAQFAGLLVLGVWLRWVGHPLAPNRVLLSRMVPNPKLLKTPIVRNGQKVTAGFCPDGFFFRFHGNTCRRSGPSFRNTSAS